MINNRTDAWKTDVNLLKNYLKIYFVHLYSVQIRTIQVKCTMSAAMYTILVMCSYEKFRTRRENGTTFLLTGPIHRCITCHKITVIKQRKNKWLNLSRTARGRPPIPYLNGVTNAFNLCPPRINQFSSSEVSAKLKVSPKPPGKTVSVHITVTMNLLTVANLHCQLSW